MNRNPTGTKTIVNDRLVKHVVHPDGTIIRQGKRVSANFNCISQAAKRAYVVHGSAKAIRQIMADKGCSLADAFETINMARHVPWAIPPRLSPNNLRGI